MTPKTPTRTLPELIEGFLTHRLPTQQRVSAHTLTSYRDTLRLLLLFIEKDIGRSPSQQDLADWDAPHILKFLDYLEQQRACQSSTRNVRLAALRSFMRYASQQEPTALAITQRVLTIPMKRCDRRLLGFLTTQEVEAILAATDPLTHSGRRDHLLFNLLYHTGARVSEIVAIQRQDLTWNPLPQVQLHGKGRKQRAVPLPKPILPELKRHLLGLPESPTALLFCNRFGQGLTRSGVAKRLTKIVRLAAHACPSLKGGAISPHTFRHACAMHLLQAKVDITTIALFLGHESPSTTHRYIELDLQMKEQCLRLKTAEIIGQSQRWPTMSA